MNDAIRCGCQRSLAVICAAFATAAVIAFFAEDRCLDVGGRLSDSAWSCESAAGVIDSLWSLVTPQMIFGGGRHRRRAGVFHGSGLCRPLDIFWP